MKRLVGGSCLGLLLLVTLGGMVALFAFTIFFQQSQAVSSNTAGTLDARATATWTARPPTTIPAQTSAVVVTALQSDEVII